MRCDADISPVSVFPYGMEGEYFKLPHSGRGLAVAFSAPIPAAAWKYFVPGPPLALWDPP